MREHTVRNSWISFLHRCAKAKRLAKYKLNWMLRLFIALSGQVGWVLGCECLRALEYGSCLRLFTLFPETFLSSQFPSEIEPELPTGLSYLIITMYLLLLSPLSPCLTWSFLCTVLQHHLQNNLFTWNSFTCK